MLLERWNAKGGYKEALNIGFPLVISMASTTVMSFTDRVFLGGYSLDALSASFPASITAFLFLSFFLGTIEYVNVFVAQYTGAQQHEKVGSVIWQGLWMCVPSAVILALAGFAGHWIFSLSGHIPHVQELEATYYSIMSFGGGINLAAVCLSCFYSGRGITKPVMFVNLFAAALNIPLNYVLINGYYGFPEMGIAGAALATVFAWSVMLVCFAALVFSKANESEFQTRSQWKLYPSLFKKIIHFGFPSGVQFFLDIFAVTAFSLLAGRIGVVELAATNAAISIDTLSFLPTIGMSIAASVMVGQYMGSGEPDKAAYSIMSVLHLSLVYMIFMAVWYVMYPEFLMNLFKPREFSAEQYAPVLGLGVVLLRYVAGFAVIDAVTIVMFGGLKGTGDTRYTMLVMGGCSLIVMVIPGIILTYLDMLNVHVLWIMLLSYVFSMGTLFVIRFRSGKWRQHQLVDESASTESA